MELLFQPESHEQFQSRTDVLMGRGFLVFSLESVPRMSVVPGLLLSKFINIVGSSIKKKKILWLTCLGVLVFLKRSSAALYLPFGSRRVILSMCISQQTFVDFVPCAGLGLRNVQGNSGHERLPFLAKHGFPGR